MSNRPYDERVSSSRISLHLQLISATVVEPPATETTETAATETTIVRDCARLYSTNYGVWNDTNKTVRVSADFMRRTYMFDDACFMMVYQVAGDVIGYACARTFVYHDEDTPPSPFSRVECEQERKQAKKETVAIWFSQLVVRHDYRNRGIATRICRASIDHMIEKNDAMIDSVDTVDTVDAVNTRSRDQTRAWACGIASSNPYAVRAVEKACACACDVVMMKDERRATDFMRASGVSFLRGKPYDPVRCIVDTGFDVNTRCIALEKRVRNLLENGKWTHPCTDNAIPRGHEYVAIFSGNGSPPPLIVFTRTDDM